MRPATLLIACFISCSAAFPVFAADAPAPAPKTDRVGFPKDYAATYQVLRTVIRDKDQKIVTIYGNSQAASITNSAQLPYPYGSVIVMESAALTKDAEGKAIKGKVSGMHVMRREKGFGEAYAENRTGEWEYVEYKSDGSYITPPEKSASCAECHVKAGAKKDFVYAARLAPKAEK